MDPQFHIGEDLSALERALQDLAPAPARLDVATMFRAGQAAARPSSAWQRVWPATSAALALLCVTLGVLLAVPQRPQIVHVPVDGAGPATPATPAAMLAAEAGAAAQDTWPLPEPVPPRPRWSSDLRPLSGISYLQVRDLALVSPWNATTVLATAPPRACSPSLSSGDWRAMVGDEHPRASDGEPASVHPLDWQQLLNTRGS